MFLIMNEILGQLLNEKYFSLEKEMNETDFF